MSLFPTHTLRTLTWVVMGVYQAFGQPGGNRVTWEGWLPRDKPHSSKSLGLADVCWALF